MSIGEDDSDEDFTKVSSNDTNNKENATTLPMIVTILKKKKTVPRRVFVSLVLCNREKESVVEFAEFVNKRDGVITSLSVICQAFSKLK